jgi:hypothetical protein
MLHHLARTRALMGDAAAAAALSEHAARIAADCGDAALGRACAAGNTTVSGAAAAPELP